MFQQLKTEGREGIVFKAHRASYEPGRPNIGEKRVRHFYKNADVLESVGDLPRAVMGIVEGVMGKRAKTKAYAEVRRMD
ncbi:MAG TPA: hypothetical protein VKX17_09500 [Planctomycetota bacterium]|nr:hypothetical protein [Planctomycetota bacterium]